MTTSKNIRSSKIGSMEIVWGENGMRVKNLSEWVKNRFNTLKEVCKVADTFGFNADYVFAGIIFFGDFEQDFSVVDRIWKKWIMREVDEFIEDITFFARVGSSLHNVFAR